MATWKALDQDNLLAAKALLAGGHLRSSINRSYYAAYSAATGRLLQRNVQFPRGWNNPAHEQVLALIRNGLALTPNTRRQIEQSVRRLRLARESADYRPSAFIDRNLAAACIFDATLVIKALED